VPRVCARAGCGKLLLNKCGNPDFRKHWCGVEHKNLDRKEAQELRRKTTKGRRCRLCGLKAPATPCVPRDTGRRRNLAVDLNEDRKEEDRLRSERLQEEVIV
jgi:hypothetical protein